MSTGDAGGVTPHPRERGIAFCRWQVNGKVAGTIEKGRGEIVADADVKSTNGGVARTVFCHVLNGKRAGRKN